MRNVVIAAPAAGAAPRGRCRAAHELRRPRHLRRAKPTALARLGALALALGVLGVIANGEHWLLEHPATATPELIAATCAVDAVFDDPDPAGNGCAALGPGNDKEHRP
jgi:hypothetical protein